MDNREKKETPGYGNAKCSKLIMPEDGIKIHLMQNFLNKDLVFILNVYKFAA